MNGDTVAVVDLGAPELVIILLLVLLLFGGAKLPGLARSLGRAQREYREGLEDDSKPHDHDHD